MADLNLESLRAARQRNGFQPGALENITPIENGIIDLLGLRAARQNRDIFSNIQQAHPPQPKFVGPPDPFTVIGTPRWPSENYQLPKRVVSREVPQEELPPDPFGRPEPDRTKPLGYVENIVPPVDIPAIVDPTNIAGRTRYRSLTEQVGLPEIFKGIREMIVPTTEYTKREWAQQLKETPEKILWTLKYIPTLGGRLGGKDFRKKLLEQAEEFAGFGPAVAPAGGESIVLALEWLLIYPKLFQAVGIGGQAISKIPRVAKAGETIRKMGGLSKVAEKFPRLYARAANVAKAFGKGAGAGGIIAAAETIGKEKEPSEALKSIAKRGGLVGGVAAGFQAVSEIDTALYVRKLRGELLNRVNQQFSDKIKQIAVMPAGRAKSAARSSIASLKKTALQKVDDIVSSAEAQLLRLKGGKLYQTGQEQIESPLSAAERLMRYGYEPGQAYPKGEPLLRKGFGRPEPFRALKPEELPTRPTTKEVRIAEAARAKAAQPAREIPTAPRPVAKPKAPEPTAPKVVPVPPAIEKKVPAADIDTQPPAKVKTLDEIRAEGQKKPDVLVEMPAEKPSRTIEPAKGKKKTVVDLKDRDNVITFTDFGSGIAAKGKTLYHLATQSELGTFDSVQAARKAATSLAETAINWKDKNFDKIRQQWMEWLHNQGIIKDIKGLQWDEKDKIVAYLTGKGKELDVEDYIKAFSGTALKKINHNLDRAVSTIASRIKAFAKDVPEFTLNPTFTFDKESGQLVFKDRYRFGFYPEYLGFSAEDLKDGQTIRFDLASFNIKEATKKALKQAEAFLGEPKILGRTPEKPIPVKKYGGKFQMYTQRKKTEAEEAYERSLFDIETGRKVVTESGVERQVTEGDIRRVAELGRKAGRQGWTVEREILLKQEKGTAESKVSFGDTIRIVREVFAAEQPEKPKPGEKIILSKEDFPVDIGGGLQKDLNLYRNEKEAYYWSVAMANKKRLGKAEAEQFRQKLEELTGKRWTRDDVSSGIFHYNSREQAEKEKPKAVSPVMRQYEQFKGKYPDTIILAKISDFYEAFDDDAKVVSDVLGKTLTKRGDRRNAGIPYHEIDSAMKKLIKAGHKVAVMEQPAKPKKIEPGTPMSLEDAQAFWKRKRVKYKSEFDDGKWVTLQDKYEGKVINEFPALLSKDGKQIVYFYYVGKGAPFNVVMGVGTEVSPDRIIERPPEKPEAEEISEFIPAGSPDNIQNVVVDTFREWPASIKKVGKDFYVEIMAAAKQLLTPYRYRALRRTLLGAFRHKKRPAPKVVGIELQDIRDALTAVHELSHCLDWLLNNKVFPRSIKARFPDTKAGEFALRKELAEVSKVLRPDLWKRPKPYVKGHTELMADYISMYILDPERALNLAPKLTPAFEKKLAGKPELFEVVSRLQETRYTGPEEPPVAEHIRNDFPVPKEFKPLQLLIDMTSEDYVKAAENLGLQAVRHYKLLIQRAQREADRIDKLVPNKSRQIDLVVIAERGEKNPWTGKTRQEILAGGITENERKAINLFRAYQELARQTVNKYLRGCNVAEYIRFIEDYFLHTYQTPLTEKYKTAISRWAKRSPQAKKRILPDLAKAVEIGLRPRAKTLSEGLQLWAGINFRVMTNKAFLRILPKITNDDGVSILQKPQDYPQWPTVDFWPIRQTYSVPLPGRGVLLFQGRVAVDPRVKPFIDAMFGYRSFSTPVRIIEGLNAIWKGFELTLFSFFHHQAEFFSAVGALGPRAMPFVGGYYGKRAQVFGKKKLFGFLPEHITTLQAGKELEKVPEFIEDYIAHGGQLGYISTEGINRMERMFKWVEDYLKEIIQTRPIAGKAVWLPYVPARGARTVYSWMQHLLWDNVSRCKLVAYYEILSEGAQKSDLPIKDVKELAVKYVNDNFGGQEWLNTMFRKPRVRQFWTQLMMSLDWTWSQIKTARWPFGIGEKDAARREFMKKIGRHHWFWYLSAVAGFTIAGSYAMSGKFPWENEKGHKLDIDWTNIWRKLPWNRDWQARGDYSRRYIGLGKAGRELVRWVTSPLKAFGYKLSPVARSTFEQATGYNIGSSWPEPWAREDLEDYQEIYARFKHLMENFVPFAFSGNNAFMAFPSKKGMTQWKAVKAYEIIYDARARQAAGGLAGTVSKAVHIISKDEEKLKAEIASACAANNVDSEKADRAALSGIRSKYYNKFWKASKMPEKRAIPACNALADALIALDITPKGFKQSLRYRQDGLPERAREIGIEAIQKASARR